MQSSFVTLALLCMAGASIPNSHGQTTGRTPPPPRSPAPRYSTVEVGGGMMTSIFNDNPHAVGTVIAVVDLSANLTADLGNRATYAFRIDHLRVSPQASDRTGEPIPFMSVRIIPVELEWAAGESGRAGFRAADISISRDIRSLVETQLHGRLGSLYLRGELRGTHVRASLEGAVSALGGSYQAIRSQSAILVPTGTERTLHHGTIGLGVGAEGRFRFEVGGVDANGQPLDGFYFVAYATGSIDAAGGNNEFYRSCSSGSWGCSSSRTLWSLAGTGRASVDAGAELSYLHENWRFSVLATLMGRVYFGSTGHDEISIPTQDAWDVFVGPQVEVRF